MKLSTRWFSISLAYRTGQSSEEKNFQFCGTVFWKSYLEQKDTLLDVIKANFHHQIGPEVRRELSNASARSGSSVQDIVMI
ncbi:hypothetical protein C8J56DRAFT_24195 [Mycena floridula]|nr:hypothetical protein C8J56DRAFT_24195 [Mycena floridula]